MKKNSLKKKTNFTQLNVVDKFILLINCVVLVSLTISYLAKTINPETWILPSLAEKIYPINFFATCLFIMFWSVKFKIPVIINLIIFLAGINTHNNFYKIKSNQSYEEVKETTRITTFNVRQFNKYKWIKKEDVTKKILNFISYVESDIICLQEFYDDENIKKIPLKNKYTNFDFKKQNSGLLIASNLEIINQKTILINKNTQNEAIYVDLIKNKDTLRVYNLHLTTSNNKYLENITKLIKSKPIKEKSEIIKNLKNLIPKMKNSFRQRNIEIKVVLNEIKKSPYKCILAGDFNDTPNSFTISKISKQLKDSFTESGSKSGKTYRNMTIPLRIDYIFVDQEITAKRVKTHNKILLSDHYPISADLNY